MTFCVVVNPRSQSSIEFNQGRRRRNQEQPVFKDVSWDDVVNKQIPPPHFPTIVSLLRVVHVNDSMNLICLQNGSANTSDFDEEFTREQPTLTPFMGSCRLAIKPNSMVSPTSLLGPIYDDNSPSYQ